MRWEDQRESSNVEDRRDGSGGGGGFGIGGRSIGIGTIVLALVGWGVFGINPLTTIGVLSGGSPAPVQQGPAHAPPSNDKNAAFVSVVLASTEDVWSQIFQQAGQRYPAPKLVLYRGATPTACGTGQAAMGPFYCPGDQKVYIDLGFYETLKNRLGAPGEFAQAYVIAHEVGHHVQNLVGTTAKMDQMRQRLSEAQYNAMSVRLELQADCYAGIWARQAQERFGTLDVGDLDEAMRAAEAVGDDVIQASAGRTPMPDSFTHGSAAQRQEWLMRGFDSGDMRQCDTFGAGAL